MTTLAKLELMNDDEIQNWLRKVNPTTLAIALIGSNNEIRGCVFRNMSERAAAMLSEDIDKYGTMDAKELIIHMNAGLLEAQI
jgi:flagellar motor switch protein FliG